MQSPIKRTEADQSNGVIQAGNQQWWTDSTMSYDWKEGIGNERFTPEWFDEADRRFVFASRLFAHGDLPFDKIIPFDLLKNKKVLEIGCGMGYHTELMLQAGARLTSIDISPTSIEATRTRLNQRSLDGKVLQMDARSLEFPDEYFDFIWSWGVIHHSAWTGMIVKEMARVLKPGCESRIMVYNLNGMGAYITILRDYLLGFWRGRTMDECLWRRTDGYMARYYSKDILSDIFRIFFRDVEVKVFGQDADAIPLPRQLRRPLMRLISPARLEDLVARRGGFLFLTATK